MYEQGIKGEPRADLTPFMYEQGIKGEPRADLTPFTMPRPITYQ